MTSSLLRRRLCMIILLAGSLLFLPLTNTSNNVLLLFQSKSSAFAQEGQSNNAEGGQWTGEIEYTTDSSSFVGRSYYLEDGSERWEEFGSDRFKFTGKFSFDLNESLDPAGISHYEISEQGDGYVTRHMEYTIPHVELEPICPLAMYHEPCSREYHPMKYEWAHAEGPVAFTVEGIFSHKSGQLSLTFTTESTIPAEGDSGGEESIRIIPVGEPIEIIRNPWSEPEHPAFETCLEHDSCLMETEYIDTYFDTHGLYDGAVFEKKFDWGTYKLTIHGGCDTKPETAQFKPYSYGSWHGNFGVVDGEGLVLQGVNIGNAHLLDRLSMPHSKVVFSDGQQYIRYCSSSDKHTEPQLTGDSIRWSFSRVLGADTPDDEKDDGALTISYNFVISSEPVRNCELRSYNCLRFIPIVTYTWNGQDPTYLKQFTAFYKLDYGDRTGLTLVKDINVIPYPYGYQEFQTKESWFNAVDNGVAGKFDNIHSGHIGDRVFVPGCRESIYDCFHMHWRWGDTRSSTLPSSGVLNIHPFLASFRSYLTVHDRPIIPIDPLINPFTGSTLEEDYRGKPYLVPGQTINIAIVKASSNPSEQDPDEPISSLVNDETIAFNGDNNRLISAGRPIVWYISSVDNRITTTFFVHGFFVLDTSK